MFFLNLYNFVLLYQIAAMMLSSPEGIEKLKTYSMWQALLQKTLVSIGRERISLYDIQYYIIRSDLPTPNITEFTLALKS